MSHDHTLWHRLRVKWALSRWKLSAREFTLKFVVVVVVVVVAVVAFKAGWARTGQLASSLAQGNLPLLLTQVNGHKFTWVGQLAFATYICSHCLSLTCTGFFFLLTLHQL